MHPGRCLRRPRRIGFGQVLNRGFPAVLNPVVGPAMEPPVVEPGVPDLELGANPLGPIPGPCVVDLHDLAGRRKLRLGRHTPRRGGPPWLPERTRISGLAVAR